MLAGAKKALSVLLVVGLAVVMLVVGALGGWKYRDFSAESEKKDLELKYLQQIADAQKQDAKESDSNRDNTNDNQTPTTTSFTGKFLKATLKKGWTLVEHSNGAGSTILTSGVTYKGLTGVELKNPSNTTVFKMQAVYGIGGTDQCTTYAKFSDFNLAHYNQINAANVADFGQAVTLTDLTTQTYSSFTLLGAKTRRIGTTLYWDIVPAGATFEPACGMMTELPKFTGISFTANAAVQTGYNWKIVGTPSNSDLQDMDTILGTISTL